MHWVDFNNKKQIITYGKGEPHLNAKLGDIPSMTLLNDVNWVEVSGNYSKAELMREPIQSYEQLI